MTDFDGLVVVCDGCGYLATLTIDAHYLDDDFYCDKCFDKLDGESDD